MTPPFRLAFVGPPEMVSPWLLRAVGQTDAQFVAICAEDAARAERAAAEFHVRWPYQDLGTLLAEAQPHGVITAAPLSHRETIVRRCLAAGVSVLVIGLPLPPPGRPPACGRALLWGAAAPRFAPAGTLVRRMIESGKIGDVLSLTVSLAHWRSVRSVADAAWPVSPDLVFQAVDWIEDLVGPAQEVLARGHPDGSLMATLVCRRDVPVSLALHEHGPPERSGAALELRSTDGALLVLDREMRLACQNGTRTLASYTPALGASDPAVEFGYVGLIKEFLRRMSDGHAHGSAAKAASETGHPSGERGLSSPVRTTQAILSAVSRSGSVRLERKPRGRAADDS
jgi:predicted dehydrogenase